MAVDFRQPAFRPGQHYPLTVSIDGHFSHRFDAPAYDDSILIVSAADGATAQSFYKALAGGQQLTLRLGRQTIDFALLGATNGLQRLEACYGVSPAPATEQLAGNGPAIPTIVVHPSSPPPALGGVSTALSPLMTGAPTADGISTPPAEDAPLPEPQQAGSALPQSAEAAAAVLPAPPPESQPEPAETAVAIPPPSGKPADMPGDAPATRGTAAWTVKSHASLRATLQAWSDQRGADLVWTMPGDLPVPESLSMDGSYEQAVQALLTEYENASPRPAGGLVIDPATGRRQLTIRSVGP